MTLRRLLWVCMVVVWPVLCCTFFLTLGKLTADQVLSGYAALKVVEQCINRNDFGDSLVQACNQFYTRVPHCFG